MKKNTIYKYALLAIFAGLFLTTSARAGFLYTLNDIGGASNKNHGYSVN